MEIEVIKLQSRTAKSQLVTDTPPPSEPHDFEEPFEYFCEGLGLSASSAESPEAEKMGSGDEPVTHPSNSPLCSTQGQSTS